MWYIPTWFYPGCSSYMVIHEVRTPFGSLALLPGKSSGISPHNFRPALTDSRFEAATGPQGCQSVEAVFEGARWVVAGLGSGTRHLKEEMSHQYRVPHPGSFTHRAISHADLLGSLNHLTGQSVLAVSPLYVILNFFNRNAT